MGTVARRPVLKGAAWSVPVIAGVFAAPGVAASVGGRRVPGLAFVHGFYSWPVDDLGVATGVELRAVDARGLPLPDGVLVVVSVAPEDVDRLWFVADPLGPDEQEHLASFAFPVTDGIVTLDYHLRHAAVAVESGTSRYLLADYNGDIATAFWAIADVGVS